MGFEPPEGQPQAFLYGPPPPCLGNCTPIYVVARHVRSNPANYHRYEVNVVAQCAATDVFKEFTSKGGSAPGAPAAKEGFTERLVLSGNNPISQYVNFKNMTIINTALPGHRYYPGTVTIQVSPDGEESRITIVGTGSGERRRENVLAGLAFFGGEAALIVQGCAMLGMAGQPVM